MKITIFSAVLAFGIIASAAAIGYDFTDTLPPETTPYGNPFGAGATNCNGTSCLSSEEECINDKCSCKEGRQGAASLGCLPGNLTICNAANDPATTSLQGEFFHINTLCAYRMLEYNYWRPQRQNYNTRCLARVEVANIRYNGKISVGGLDVRVNYWNQGQYQSSPQIVTFRVLGNFNPATNQYEFQRRARIGQLDIDNWSPPNTLNIGFNYHFVVQASRKRVYIRIDDCGLHLYFRPARPDNVRERTSGIVFGVRNDNAQIQWRNTNTTTCMGPAETNQDRVEYIADRNALTHQQGADFLVLTNNKQTLSFLPLDCFQMYNTLRDECDTDAKRSRAIKLCSDMLAAPHFIRCISESQAQGVSTNLIQLFTICVNAACNRSNGLCQMAKSIMTDKCGAEANDLALSQNSCLL